MVQGTGSEHGQGDEGDAGDGGDGGTGMSGDAGTQGRRDGTREAQGASMGKETKATGAPVPLFAHNAPPRTENCNEKNVSAFAIQVKLWHIMAETEGIFMAIRIIHFSDPHAGGPAEDWMAYLDKRWVGVFNYRFRRRFRHDQSKFKRAVEYILDTRPDIAVCTGDLTSTGQPGEFAVMREILRPLRESSIPLIYTPGNHDCYVHRPSCMKAVNDTYREVNRGREFTDLPVRLEICGIDFLVVNTSRPSNLLCSWGFLDHRDAEWIAVRSQEHPGVTKILVNHYPMFEDHPFLRVRHRLFGEKPVRRLIESGAIDLSLCGHVHKPYCRVDATGRGENCAGSVTRNGSMVEILFDGKNFTYKTIQL